MTEIQASLRRGLAFFVARLDLTLRGLHTAQNIEGHFRHEPSHH